MSDGRRKWNTSHNSFRHRNLSDSSEKRSPKFNRKLTPLINISPESDDKFTLSRTPSIERQSGDSVNKIVSPTIMPRIHLLSSSQRRRKFMQRGTTISNEYYQYSHDDEHTQFGPPHILEDLEHLSHTSRSSSNSDIVKNSNRPPTLPDGSLPSPGFLSPPDIFKSNLCLLEQPPHKQVMLR
ncbi:Hypothetical protein SRAE_1000026100 [Strongyloides ratti]|uniref:Uncharacterized protein n=1 Tax=Strongyloides ratti TaxID=34506 RepID=A0A090KWU8_STRRB|nr:Hypothetical protein SRAE_1000026100 [Strongyloides ratti]CEF61985.1 Hypothetical protein SRAE_1000026100 [Strongyloides ratti]